MCLERGAYSLRDCLILLATGTLAMGKYRKFTKALYASWGKDTAYRKDAENWTPQNPAIGQCAITALLFNELYGGKIYSGESDTGIVHYWNRRFGIKYDFTKQQFSEDIRFRKIRKWNRDELLATGNVAERYEILKSRVLHIIEHKAT